MGPRLAIVLTLAGACSYLGSKQPVSVSLSVDEAYQNSSGSYGLRVLSIAVQHLKLLKGLKAGHAIGALACRYPGFRKAGFVGKLTTQLLMDVLIFGVDIVARK